MAPERVTQSTTVTAEQVTDRSDLFNLDAGVIRSVRCNGHHLHGACVAIRIMPREQRTRSVGIFAIVTRIDRQDIMTENNGEGVLEYAVTAYRDGRERIRSRPGLAVSVFRAGRKEQPRRRCRNGRTAPGRGINL